MRPLIIALTVAAGIIIATVAGLKYAQIIPAFPTFFVEIVVFLFATTVVLFRLVVRAKENFFVQAYLLSMVVKLLGYGAFLFFVIMDDRQNAVPNVVLFLVGYLLFTALEIFYLYRRIRG